jgi:hypothetical protein
MTHLMTLTMSVLAESVLADAPNQTGPDFGKASPVGLLILVVLLIATFFLVWSMNRHLKKLPESFDAAPDLVVADQGPGAEVDKGTEVVGGTADEPRG